MAVGRQRQVERFAGDGAQTGQFPDQIHEPAAQQRFAAREADLGYPQVDEKPDDAQVFVDGELGVLGAVLAGAAIDAFVIAAVGDGDAQIVNHPPVTVSEPCIWEEHGGSDQRRIGHRTLQGYTVWRKDAAGVKGQGPRYGRPRWKGRRIQGDAGKVSGV